jgi:hypothetical protein
MLHLTGKNKFVLEQEGPKLPPQGGYLGFRNVQPFGVGRVSYIHRVASQTRGARKDYPPESQRELCNFAIYYGHSTPAMQDPGRQPAPGKEVMIWFATVEQPVPRDFMSKADSMQYQGDSTITAKRLEV